MNNSQENKRFEADFLACLSSAGNTCQVRLAPTPSGFLHIGNALNFVLNAVIALHSGGSILLRIDDIDADRKRPEYVADIFESLPWLGIPWHEGPGLENADLESQVANFEAQWSQHRRLHLSQTLLNRLREMDLLFACRMSRSQLAPFGGAYPDSFRNQGLSLDEPDVAWRIKTEGLPASMQDFIVRRRDGLPAYQIASLADDLFFGITHIVRGSDLEPSTQAQLFLARCLGEDQFQKIHFLHHPLLTDQSGEKLSKSAGAASLRAQREKGASAAAVYQAAAELLSLPPVEHLDALMENLTARIGASRK